jgi:hypothetical protein
MRTAWQSFPIEYKGGLITNMAPLQHGVSAPGSATVLQNFEPSIEGGYKKVLGYSKWNEHPVPGEGLITGVVATDTDNLIAVRESKYYTSVGREDWVERLDLSGDPGGKIRHTTFNFDGTSKICMVDGVNKPVFWDSSDQSIYEDTDAPSDVEGAQRVITFKNHLFFSKGSNLIFTAPFDEEDYDSANGAGVINVGSRIVGMIVFREQLIVFSVSRIQRITGNTGEDFALQPITMDTGAFCGDTIQEVGGDVLYLGPDGVRYLSATERIGDFALERASEQIQSRLVDFFAQCDNYSSVVVRSKSQYRIFRFDEDITTNLSRGFLATRFRDQDSFGVAWAELVGFKLYNSDSKLFRDKEVIVFCNEADHVYEMENGNSLDGTAIEGIFQTPFIPIEDSRIRKTYYKHTLYLNPEADFELTFNMIFDYNQRGVLQPPPIRFSSEGSVNVLWGTSKWGEFNWAGELTRVYPSNVLGSSFVVAFRFYDRSTNPSFTIDTSVLEFTFNDRK